MAAHACQAGGGGWIGGCRIDGAQRQAPEDDGEHCQAQHLVPGLHQLAPGAAFGIDAPQLDQRMDRHQQQG
ncbi:MAG TPA: hypothetical protein PLG70_03425, partial [Ottowia sp.]|nr:hypothetical protein [Ottowia sp.]